MKVLLIGSGGREHALAWKIMQSSKVSELFIAPGNAGTMELGTNVDIKATDIEGLLEFAKANSIDLTVVGPEDPLVMGISNVFEDAGLRVFGPRKEGAILEGSKAFSKDFMIKHNIPTAQYKNFTDPKEALKNIGMYGYPIVIKADGLAAGKGVIIAEDEKQASDAIKSMMEDSVFGDAGNVVVIEEFLTGIEASVLCFVDGNSIVPLESAQDYKRAYDNDEGLNTGGMGTYSPSVLFDDNLDEIIKREILNPFHKAVLAENMDYRGLVFIGLMIEDKVPKVIEFNVRFGDPETQSVLPRMESDIVEVFEAVIDNKLNELDLKWKKNNACCIVLTSGGYPESYKKGYEIKGLDTVKDMLVFHAGTAFKDGNVVTNGGRVLNVVAYGDTLEEARIKAYEGVKKISFEGMEYRTDIAKL